MDLSKLYGKYRVKSDGLQRRYLIPTYERKFDLEGATPIELVVLVPNKQKEDMIICSNGVNMTFQFRSWVELLKEFVTYLQSNFPKTKEDLLAFRTDWSKAKIFDDNKSIKNMVQIDDDLFFSVNYSATHSSWIIGDLLKFYDISQGMISIHRVPANEPKEIKDAVKQMRKEEFKEFLKTDKAKSDEQADKIVNNIETLNKIILKMETSYNDFFLIDETRMVSVTKSRFLQNIKNYVKLNEAQLNAVKKNLEYLTAYYTKVNNKAKNHKEDLEFYFPII